MLSSFMCVFVLRRFNTVIGVVKMTSSGTRFVKRAAQLNHEIASGITCTLVAFLR